MDPDALPGFGHGPFTQQKYDDFRELLALHLRICAQIFRKYPRARYTYHYLELNAGPGLWCHPDAPHRMVKGTPLLAFDCLEEANAVAARSAPHEDGYFPYRIDLIERDDAAAAFLGAVIRDREAYEPNWSGVRLHHGDHDALAPAIANLWAEDLDLGVVQRIYGLIFHDPTGLPNFRLLRRLAAMPSCRHLDLLLYVQATPLKRNANRPADPERGAPLQARLARIDKRYWLVREPDGQHQFSFLLGTNWADFPAWRKRRFHRVDEPEGRELLERLSFDRDTYEQRRAARNGTPLAALALAHADGERWGQPVDPAVEDEDD